MSNEIKIGTPVVCPVTDNDDEVSYETGTLISINSRWATVEIDGEKIRVGKTKIEPVEPIETIPEKALKVRPGIQCRSASGRKSLDNGDIIAADLRGKTLEHTYKVAAKHLKESVSALTAKYQHLNPGQQRMCLGNRLRGALKATS